MIERNKTNEAKAPRVARVPQKGAMERKTGKKCFCGTNVICGTNYRPKNTLPLRESSSKVAY